MIILNQILIFIGFVLCIVRWFYINYRLSIKQPKIIIPKEKPIPISTNTQQPVSIISNIPALAVSIIKENYEYDIVTFGTVHNNIVISESELYENIKSTLNQKSIEGWELVHSDNNRHYLKRRVKELV
jgi:hypothetical protein